ncbi:hypothetical protein [Bacillus wiedmannii]|uniref:hypothetical protein n=1 Tax=Bacillus wiedmannii TaxID=1890302 RepID=UPI0015CF5955|nr:hypothetical protein [Bacillus wiedmannii]
MTENKPPTREELEKFCRESAEQFGTHETVDWGSLPDNELNSAVEWFDYLWEK